MATYSLAKEEREKAGEDLGKEGDANEAHGTDLAITTFSRGGFLATLHFGSAIKAMVLMHTISTKLPGDYKCFINLT